MAGGKEPERDDQGGRGRLRREQGSGLQAGRARVNISICVSIYLCMYVSIYLSIHPSMYLPIYICT